MHHDSFSDLEGLVSHWVHAFNMRDLDGLLARMDPNVLFFPLRLNGAESSYRGHDGVRDWFACLDDGHRITLLEVQPCGEDEALAMGELRFSEDADPAPFWARNTIERRRIVLAHHYMTEPGIFAKIGRKAPL